MLTVLQVVVFLMGIMSLVLSGHYLLFFIRVERRVAKSMVFLMFEQMVSASGTMVFSVNSLLGSLGGEDAQLWNNINPLVAIIIRMSMFGAMLHSNIHLTYSIRKVIEPIGNPAKVLCDNCKKLIPILIFALLFCGTSKSQAQILNFRGQPKVVTKSRTWKITPIFFLPGAVIHGQSRTIDLDQWCTNRVSNQKTRRIFRQFKK